MNSLLYNFYLLDSNINWNKKYTYKIKLTLLNWYLDFLLLKTKNWPTKGFKLSNHFLEKLVFDNVPEILPVLSQYQIKGFKIFYY